MKKRLVLPLLIFSVLLNVFLVLKSPGEQDKKEELQGTVVRVIDGDTFDLEGEVRIRLAGVEAPEYPKGCLSNQAKERLEELILGKEVEIEVIEKDNFGRQIGFIRVGDVFIDKILVEEGLARVVLYSKRKKLKHQDEFIQAEREAKEKNLGIWEKK